MSCEHARSEPLSSDAAASRSLWVVLASAVLAALTLSAALWVTRPSSDALTASERLMGSTPERAAESFIEAYQSGAFDRASHFATGQLAQTLAARPKSLAELIVTERASFIVQESYRLESQRLRLSGVLVRAGQAESEGKAVSLTLQKHNDRYLVEEITW
jgi:hypothetical protein